MKRTYMKATLALLIVATVTSCYNLAPENTGALTSADIYRGEGNILKIDSLVDYVKSLAKEKEDILNAHSSTSENFVTTTYRYDGKHSKTVTISCDLTQTPDSIKLTGDHQKDSVTLFWANNYKERGLLKQRVYDVVKNTCLLLANEVKEQNKSLWESHHDGIDSVRYSIALREYPQGDTLSRWTNIYGTEYNTAPELITFSFTPFSDATLLASKGALGVTKGFGRFTYTYTPDSVYDRTYELLDKKEFEKFIKPIFKQKGIESRPFYLSHDKDCPDEVSLFSFGQETTPMEMIVMKEMHPYSPSTGEQFPPSFSETKGTIYTIKSAKQLESVLHQLDERIWQYIDAHPHLWYEFTPDLTITDGKLLAKLSPYFQMSQWTPLYEDVSIILHRYQDTFHILVLNTTGDFWLPAEWPIVKSWENGNVTYVKHPQLTKKELRDYISGTMRHQGSYQAWE
ncbi:MAG: hypothetical protein IJ693_05575 [Bacteroidaceae bacterium]|nr:hypothetical protein [Bacteroidaceae bacterium]